MRNGDPCTSKPSSWSHIASLKYSALTVESAIFNRVAILNILKVLRGQFLVSINVRLLTCLATAEMMALCPQTQVLPDEALHPFELVKILARSLTQRTQ